MDLAKYASEVDKQMADEKLKLEKYRINALQRYANAWHDPRTLPGYDENYEDGKPWLPGMSAAKSNSWKEIVERLNRVGEPGYQRVMEAWKEYVEKQFVPPEQLEQHMLEKLKKLEESYAKKAEAKALQEFHATAAKEGALTEDELEALNCSVEATRDMFIAAGYGAQWFDIDALSGVHKAMALRLFKNDMLEKMKKRNTKLMTIVTVYRVKGT